jgi:hypothetical protein
MVNSLSVPMPPQMKYRPESGNEADLNDQPI